MVALGADEVGHPELAGARGAADDDVGEEGAEHGVDVRVGELLDHLGAALRVGAVVLEQDLDRAAVDAAGRVEHRRAPRWRCARTSGRRRRRCRCGAAGSRGGSARRTGPARSRASSAAVAPAAMPFRSVRRVGAAINPSSTTPPLSRRRRSGAAGVRRTLWGSGALVHGNSGGFPEAVAARRDAGESHLKFRASLSG